MRFKAILFGAVSWLCLLGPLLTSAEEMRPTFAMFSDPAIEIPVIDSKLPDGIVDLWRAALKRPEASYQRSAALDLREAHQRGFQEVKVATPELKQLLSDDHTEGFVREAVVQTLIEFEARDVADQLFVVAQEGGLQYRLLIEPTLAAWNYQPILPNWRKRLVENSPRRRELLLACQGCGMMQDEESLASLLGIVHDSNRPQDFRIAAARAAGQISQNGLETDVETLLATDRKRSLTDRMCAVLLLQRHSSAASQDLLARMFSDPAGPIAGQSIARLLDIHPQRVLDLNDEAWEHPNVNVRRVAAKCLIGLPTEERIRQLATHLDDPNPSLRGLIRDALLLFGEQPEFESIVRLEVESVLNADDWRGQEQACLILGELNHEPAADRIVELLNSPRPEVLIASAWSLRKISVAETLPAMLSQAEHQTAQPQGNNLAAVDRQVAHLFEGMALMNYRPAIELMRKYVPKELSHRRLSRGAAVWGLGYLLADAQDEALEAQLMSRALDGGGIPPEIEIVIHMSVISLGRMKAQSQLRKLKQFSGPSTEASRLELALQWAIREISGETIPFAEIAPGVERGWRLEPIKGD